MWTWITARLLLPLVSFLLRQCIVRSADTVLVGKANLTLRYFEWLAHKPPAYDLPTYEFYEELIPGYHFKNSEDGLWWYYRRSDDWGWHDMMDGGIVFTLMAYRDHEISQQTARQLLATNLPKGKRIGSHVRNWK